ALTGEPDDPELWVRRRTDRSEGSGGSAVPATRPCRRQTPGAARRWHLALPAAARAAQSREALSSPRSVRSPRADGLCNLGTTAFEGRQAEVHVAFDGERAWRLFDTYYQRDWKDSVPVEPDTLVTTRPDGTPAPRDAPLALDEVPIVRVL